MNVLVNQDLWGLTNKFNDKIIANFGKLLYNTIYLNIIRLKRMILNELTYFKTGGTSVNDY